MALLSIDAGPTPPCAVAAAGPGVAAMQLRHVIALPDEDIRGLAALSEASGDAERRRRRLAVGLDPADGALRPFSLDLEYAAHPGERFVPHPADLARACAAVDGIRAVADIVVVALHYHQWDADWLKPPFWFDVVASRLRAAGAHAVVGTGPPWSFPAAADAEGISAPGLGNLVFHTRRAERYDALGLPVWVGTAAVLDRGTWATRDFAVLRPGA